MKLLFSSYRTLLLALLVALSSTACKKGSDDPEPAADLATRIAGQYNYSELSYNGKTLPADETNLKGSINVVRETASTVTLEVNIRMKSTGDEFLVGTVEEVEVTEAGSGNVAFVYDGEEIAVLKGKKLAVNGSDEDDVPFIISATK